VAFYVLHHYHKLIIDLFEAVYGSYVGMFEACGGFRFASEALEAFLAGTETFRKDLDGYLTLQGGVLGKIHFTHASSPERAEDVVVAYLGTLIHALTVLS
jgi:hypothetical protein